ncbi:MAG: hypothetical protein U0271_36995 [Polyangiaceae bacterium]
MTTTLLRVRVPGAAPKEYEGAGARWANSVVSLRQSHSAIQNDEDGVAIHCEFWGIDGTDGLFEFLIEEATTSHFLLSVDVAPRSAVDRLGRPIEDGVPRLLQLRQRFSIGERGAVEATVHPLVYFDTMIEAGGRNQLLIVLRSEVHDVTDLFLRTMQARFREAFFATTDGHVVERDGRKRFSRDDFGGCEVRLTEDVDGKVEVILVPPAVEASDERVAIVDLHIAVPAYSGLTDVDLIAVSRLIGSFGDGLAMRDRRSPTLPTLRADTYRGFRRPGAAPSATEHIPVEVDDTEHIDSVVEQLLPRVRLAEQLARSGKKAVVNIHLDRSTTLPRRRHGRYPGDYGRGAPRLNTAHLLGWLHGHGLIGSPDRATPTLDKLVYAGHGAAGKVAALSFAQAKSEVDELWLFDCDEIQSIWPYIRERGTTKLRLIAGRRAHHQFLLQRMSALGDSAPADDDFTIPTSVGDATVWPRSETFWTKSIAYADAYPFIYWSNDVMKRAHYILDEVEAAALDEGRRQGEDATTYAVRGVSARLGLLRVVPKPDPADRFTLAAWRANGHWTAQKTFAGFAMGELCSAYGYERPHTDNQFFRRFDTMVRHASIRHLAWSLFGWQAVSSDKTEARSSFKSYFELCLQHSGIQSGRANDTTQGWGEWAEDAQAGRFVRWEAEVIDDEVMDEI